MTLLYAAVSQKRETGQRNSPELGPTSLGTDEIGGQGRSSAKSIATGLEETMTIKTGERMPAGVFGIMTAEGPGAISSEELFAGKTVVFLTMPGAFTPTCSARHLPGFIEDYEVLVASGVDEIVCMAVNDLFVMDAWGKDQGAGDKVRMLADGNADYSRALGIDVDSRAFGMGIRSKRAAIIVQDGVAQFVAIDEPGKFEVSGADKVLDALSTSTG
jgi:peroxiredoxin